MKNRIYKKEFIYLSLFVSIVMTIWFAVPTKSQLQEIQGEFQQSPSQTFMVTNNGDSGAGSLAAAITSANGSAGLDTIAFNLPDPGIQFIPLPAALPTVTDAVIIDGTTQPGYTGTPLIALSGISNGAALNITAGGSTIKGLSFTSFIGTGNN